MEDDELDVIIRYAVDNGFTIDDVINRKELIADSLNYELALFQEKYNNLKLKVCIGLNQIRNKNADII